MIKRILCAIFGHGHDEDYSRIAFTPRLAGKSRHHVKVKGQKTYVSYGMSYRCCKCKEDLFQYFDK